MRRALGWGLLAALAAGAAASPLWAPPLLREVAWFDAREVEVTGTRMLAPHEVMQVTGIRPGVSVWTDPAAWEAALRRHPAVAEVEITRRLPATLRVRVVERRAVALLEDGVLRPATADGRVLPASPVDLPLLRVRAAVQRGRVTDAAARAALAEMGRLGELDPALLARVSEVRPAAGGGLRLALVSPSVEVLLPGGADSARLLRLRAALGDVARRMAADSAAAGRAQVDARWEDQIVVRLRG
jgi:cell division protein FtsQ